MLRGAHRQILEELFLDLFQPEEFRRFVEDLDPNLRHDMLIGPLTPAALVHDTVIILEQRGYINPRLFDLLVEVRPLRENKIKLAAMDAAATYAPLKIVKGKREAMMLLTLAEELVRLLNSSSEENGAEDTWDRVVLSVAAMEEILIDPSKTHRFGQVISSDLSDFVIGDYGSFESDDTMLPKYSVRSFYSSEMSVALRAAQQPASYRELASLAEELSGYARVCCRLVLRGHSEIITGD